MRNVVQEFECLNSVSSTKNNSDEIEPEIIHRIKNQMNNLQIMVQVFRTFNGFIKFDPYLSLK